MLLVLFFVFTIFFIAAIRIDRSIVQFVTSKYITIFGASESVHNSVISTLKVTDWFLVRNGGVGCWDYYRGP